MPNVKHRRGTTAKNNAYTGLEGELTVDLERKTARVHDGIQVGGFELAKQELTETVLSNSSAIITLQGWVFELENTVDTNVQPLGNELTALQALADTSGFLKKTGDGTYLIDISNYLTENQTVTVSGDVTGLGSTVINLTLATVNANIGSFGSTTQSPVLTVDEKGRITSASNSTITPLWSSVASKPTTLAGFGITDAAPLASPSLTGTPTAPTATPGTNTTQLATTAFVKATTDALLQGLSIKDAVRVATTVNLTASYVGGLLTNTGTLAALVLDGVTLAIGNRVLVKNQTTASQNGIYTVTTIGSASVAWVLTRATDANVSSEIVAGIFVFVAEGTTNADAGFVLTTNNPITLDTTSLTWTQFSGAGQITSGAGLTKSGNTIDVVTASSSRIVVNADSIDLATTGIVAGTYRSVQVDTYGRAIAGSNPSRTGWTASTGTATRSALATSTATTTQVAERLKALIDDLIALGILGV
jgi:hypothetical protein